MRENDNSSRVFRNGEIALEGDFIYEPPGSVHEESANASQTEPAQLLAMIFAKKGSTLTTPGGRGNQESDSSRDA